MREKESLSVREKNRGGSKRTKERVRLIQQLTRRRMTRSENER